MELGEVDAVIVQVLLLLQTLQLHQQLADEHLRMETQVNVLAPPTGCTVTDPRTHHPLDVQQLLCLSCRCRWINMNLVLVLIQFLMDSSSLSRHLLTHETKHTHFSAYYHQEAFIYLFLLNTQTQSVFTKTLNR